GRFKPPQLKTTLHAFCWPTTRLSGVPVCAVMMPDTCHPPSTLFAKRFELFRRTGKSYTKLMNATWVRSNCDGPSSYFQPTYGLETFCKSLPLPVPVVGSSERER